ncbi:hypothetical protein, partial [Nocardia brasiliensis]|uniref:hypothetical protein n=1 Tax=Nocardia brasiliensis TaxID=37326 RepID=UPI002456681F
MTTGDTAKSATPTQRVTAAYQRIAEVDRPEVWITLRGHQALAAPAAPREARRAAGAGRAPGRGGGGGEDQ